MRLLLFMLHLRGETCTAAAVKAVVIPEVDLFLYTPITFVASFHGFSTLLFRFCDEKTQNLQHDSKLTFNWCSFNPYANEQFFTVLKLLLITLKQFKI